MLRLLALLFLGLLLVSPRANADVRIIERAGPTCDAQFKACILVLQISGELIDDTAKQLQQIVDAIRRRAEARQYHFGFMQAELDSRGGSVDAAMAIGRILRREDAGAVVNSGAVCLSACVLVLAGGTTRSFGGAVGIHRPYFAVPKDDVSTNDIRIIYTKMLDAMRTYLREMNVAEGLADAMLQVPPESLRVLNPNDLAQFALTEVDPVTQEAFDLRQASMLGIDRSEYMRRKSLAEKECGGPAALGNVCYRNVLKNGRVEQFDFSRYGTPAK